MKEFKDHLAIPKDVEPVVWLIKRITGMNTRQFSSVLGLPQQRVYNTFRLYRKTSILDLIDITRDLYFELKNFKGDEDLVELYSTLADLLEKWMLKYYGLPLNPKLPEVKKPPEEKISGKRPGRRIKINVSKE